MTFKKGDVIATQQAWVTSNEHLYFIAQGSCIKVHEKDDGTETRVEKRYRGNVVGEMAFFLKAPRTAHIIADEDDTVLYEYTHKQMDALKEEFPYIGEHLLKHALQKMQDTVKRLTHENHLLMVMDGYEDENADDDDVLGTNEVGDTDVANNKKEAGRFGKGGAKKRMKNSETAAAIQRRAQGIADEDDAEPEQHKHSGFGILNDADDTNLSAASLAKRAETE